MNSPMKMLGVAAGRATRKIRNSRLAPIVRATSRYDMRTFDTPDAVSIVTGNHTASAINAAPEKNELLKTAIARGISAVAGIGPTSLSTGMPQYRTRDDQPMDTPLIRPSAVPMP